MTWAIPSLLPPHHLITCRSPRWEESLFDSHLSSTFEENLRHMRSAHSFAVPYVCYLKDARGLFSYLQVASTSALSCILCSRSRLYLHALSTCV